MQPTTTLGTLRHRPFPAPSVSIFIALQALDIITTLIGLHVGASEGSIYISRLMHLGPVTGLLFSKVLSVSLACAAFVFNRQRLIVFLNYWFSAVVTWNLFAILYLAL